jgi:hypothetical protein
MPLRSQLVRRSFLVFIYVNYNHSSFVLNLYVCLIGCNSFLLFIHLFLWQILDDSLIWQKVISQIPFSPSGGLLGSVIVNLRIFHFCGITRTTIINRFGPQMTWPLQIINEGSYTMDHMIQMRDALHAAQIRQPVTFPIRAGLSTSPESQRNILWLLEQVCIILQF